MSKIALMVSIMSLVINIITGNWIAAFIGLACCIVWVAAWRKEG